MVRGRFFFPNSARFIAAIAGVDTTRVLTVRAEDGTELAQAPFRKVKITPRLADLPRRLTLPDGACFETLDNDGVDELIGIGRHLIGGGWMDRLERSWKAIIASLALAVAATAAFVIWGMPAVALRLAMHTPEWASVEVSDQTMKVLDNKYIQPSLLDDAEQAKAAKIFASVAKTGACGPHDCKLLYRSSFMIGANAFALPDGRVVMTDAMWHAVKSDDEIAGVFAHEMAHVRFAHGLQRIYEASLVPALIMVITGDLTQVSQFAVILPGVLVQSAYSRAFETEADRSAVATLKKMGRNPAAMADLLLRLEKSRCGASGCGGSWLGDHPDTARRAAMFRNGH